MLGKILFGSLILLLAILLTFLLIPVSLRVSYEDKQLHVRLRYASWTITLFPIKKQEKEEQPDKKVKKEKKEKPQKEPQPKAKPNFQQITYSLDVLPGVLIRALRRTARRIRITPLKIHVLIAQNDPADTALLYGKLSGALNASLPLLHRSVRIEEQDIQLFPDFTQEEMDYIADVGIRLRPLDILGVAVLALGGVIKWYAGYKKRADKTDTTQNTKKKDTAQADPAA